MVSLFKKTILWFEGLILVTIVIGFTVKFYPEMISAMGDTSSLSPLLSPGIIALLLGAGIILLVLKTLFEEAEEE